jgi:hypothetical protein
MIVGDVNVEIYLELVFHVLIFLKLLNNIKD